MTPRDRFERERSKIEALAEDGEIDDRDAEVLLELGVAMDDQKVRRTYTDADGEHSTVSPRTAEKYLQCLRVCAEAGFPPSEGDTAAFNHLMVEFHDVEGKSKRTLTQYQAAAQALYRNLDLGGDPDDIDYFNPDTSPKYDETDLFDEDDVDALRAACAETQMTVRNRAFLELLVFTGQRALALLTLRLEDVEIDDGRGYIYLNEEYANANGGLKGATERGLRRPMFGAAKYVRDWVEYHPSPRDSDDWVFIPNRSHWKASEDGHWSPKTASQRLKQLKKIAGVDKPVTPHNFRHYFSTVMYRDYDLDKDTVRMLLGHAEGSRTLEEVYSHVFEDDHIKKAEEALGYREPEERNPLTPNLCPTCGEHLEESWRQCPNCQEEFAPAGSLAAATEDVREEGTNLALEGEFSQAELDSFRRLLAAIDDPDALAAALEARN